MMSNKKVAIVTGGNGGYGAGIAEVFKREGADVYITGRNEEKLHTTAERLGVKAIRADVQHAADWDMVFETVLKESGSVDFLINNAGGGINKAHLSEISDEDVIACVTINLTGVILGSKRAAVIMKERGTGTIVNISSVVAREAWPGWAVYSAAKGGLDQIHEMFVWRITAVWCPRHPDHPLLGTNRFHGQRQPAHPGQRNP
ncbi:MAG: SDR family oxidoreductase [Anaerolineae bacterium]|nr:SDR family oxidoreductase [Anaerolineae bacterium]